MAVSIAGQEVILSKTLPERARSDPDLTLTPYGSDLAQRSACLRPSASHGIPRGLPSGRSVQLSIGSAGSSADRVGWWVYSHLMTHP